MKSNEIMSHSDQTIVLVTGSIVVLLILGGFIWWLNYSYKKRIKKNRKSHLELVSHPNKPHGHRRHKRQQK